MAMPTTADASYTMMIAKFTRYENVDCGYCDNLATSQIEVLRDGHVTIFTNDLCDVPTCAEPVIAKIANYVDRLADASVIRELSIDAFESLVRDDFVAWYENEIHNG